MKIFCVRIGDRYGPEYEDYLESKLPQHEFIWIREEFDPEVQLQWNKMYPMSLDIDEPVCVIDIDILLINDYNKLFDHPIERGEFLCIRGWWRDLSPEEQKRFTINGGFYKYYPTDCKYIFDKFMSDKLYWQKKYILEGFTSGPINGEQHFVEDSINEKLKLVHAPSEWVCRMDTKTEWLARHKLSTLNRMYKIKTGKPYMFLGGEFYPDIKFVHFTHMDNHPHKWSLFDSFK